MRHGQTGADSKQAAAALESSAFAVDITTSKKCGRRQMRASAKISTAILTGGLFFQLAACGYSQEEWDQKVRENSALTQQLAAEQKANAKCAADNATANQELEGVKRQFQERGVSLDNLTQDLEQQKQANAEYRQRAEQLEQVRQRFETLRDKLKKLTELGLKV